MMFTIILGTNGVERRIKVGIKNIIFLLVGTAAGSVGTYFIMKNKFDEMVNEEIEAAKKYYEDKYEELITVKAEEKDFEEPGTKEEVQEKVERKHPANTSVEPDYDEIINKLNYNQFSTKTSNSKSKHPYIISMDEFNDDSRYIKKIISYFEEDGVCMDDETKEVIDNVGMDIGYDNLEDINTEGNEEIYIRNEKLGIDYNIVSEAGSYEDYLGIEGES